MLWLNHCWLQVHLVLVGCRWRLKQIPVRSEVLVQQIVHDFLSIQSLSVALQSLYTTVDCWLRKLIGMRQKWLLGQGVICSSRSC
jgi:hypothetical protein